MLELAIKQAKVDLGDDSVEVKVNAIKGRGRSAWLLDCEGDEAWVPFSQCNFTFNKDKTAVEKVEIPKWLAKRLFPGESF